MAQPRSRWPTTAVLWIAALLVPVRAGLSEPDAIVYGAITLNGQTVTAADTHLVVEARRLVAGPPIASYPMGSDAIAGDLYVLRLPIESSLPLNNPDASLAGDTLFIVVTEAGSILVQASCTLSGRGETQRLDLGLVASDSDQDTLPDAWEIAQFGNLTYGPTTLTLNGQTALQNYVAGTNPNDPNGMFLVQITPTADQVVVSFSGRRASGAGYENKTRYYTLQSSVDLKAGWQDVEGYTRVMGSDQLILFQSSLPNTPAFFRACVWLE